MYVEYDVLFIFHEFSILFDHFQLSINKTITGVTRQKKENEFKVISRPEHQYLLHHKRKHHKRWYPFDKFINSLGNYITQACVLLVVLVINHEKNFMES